MHALRGDARALLRTGVEVSAKTMAFQCRARSDTYGAKRCHDDLQRLSYRRTKGALAVAGLALDRRAERLWIGLVRYQRDGANYEHAVSGKLLDVEADKVEGGL